MQYFHPAFRKIRFTIAAFFIFPLLIQPIFSQSVSVRPNANPAAGQDNTAPNPKPEQKQALMVLEQALIEVKKRESLSDRIKAFIIIADMLWEHDQDRARRLFEEAFVLFEKLRKEEGERRGPYKVPGFFNYFQTEFVEIVVRRDEDLATRLIHSYGSKFDHPKVQLACAKSYLETDIEKAVGIAKKNIDVYGFDEFFESLKQKNASLAEELFAYLLSTTSQSPKERLSFFRRWYGYVFPGLKKSSQFAAYPRDASSPLRSELVTRFLKLVYEACLQEADETVKTIKKREIRSLGESEFNSALEVYFMLPAFERREPEKAAAILSRWRAIILDSKDGQETNDFIELMTNRKTVQELILMASKPGMEELADKLYAAAAHRALQDGNPDQAFAMVKKIGERDTKKDAYENLKLAIAFSTIEKGDIEGAFNQARELSDGRECNSIIEGILQYLLGKRDFTHATEIIRNTRRSIKDEYVSTYMLARAAALSDVNLAFEIVGSAIQAAGGNDADKDDSLIIGEAKDFSATFRLLGRADFEKALTLARKLNNKGSRLSAEIAVCQGVLAHPSTELNTFNRSPFDNE